MGPNGSGKSTVIKAICGFHYPDSGKIIIDTNCDITQNPEKAMEKCGYVPEVSALPPELTVKAFLLYAAKCHNLTKEQAEKRIQELSNDFSLSDFLNNKIKILSKGQQQRVSFAQGLIHNPPNLILDEPVSGLDPAQILSFRKYIKSLSATKSILLSTHILSEVNELCTKAYIMHQGRLYQVKNISNIENEFIQITREESK